MIFTDKNKLFWKFTKGDDVPTQLIPESKTEFFMVENEGVLFTFRKENNKTTLVIVPDEKTQYHFPRKNKEDF